MIDKFDNFRKLKVSFDFDGCLGHYKSVQEYCSYLLSKGVEVWIVTSRPEDPDSFFRNKYKDDEKFNRDQGTIWWSNDEDIFPLAKELGIPRDRIVFTSHDPKTWWFDRGSGFIWHLDDDPNEIRLLQRLSDVTPISVKSSNWRNKCQKLLFGEF